MQLISTYNYQSNALYVAEYLSKYGIDASIEELDNQNTISYALKVDSTKIDEVKAIVESLSLDDSEVNLDSEGYLDAHEEWNNQMYNPGYYTGGKMPYFIKKPDSITRNMFLGALLLLMPFVLFGVGESPDTKSLLFIFMVSVYIIVLVATIWNFIKKKKEDNNSTHNF